MVNNAEKLSACVELMVARQVGIFRTSIVFIIVFLLSVFLYIFESWIPPEMKKWLFPLICVVIALGWILFIVCCYWLSNNMRIRRELIKKMGCWKMKEFVSLAAQRRMLYTAFALS